MTNTSTRKTALSLMAAAAGLAMAAGAGLAQTGTPTEVPRPGAPQTQSGAGAGTTGQTGQTGATAMTTEEDVKSLLEDQGFSDVAELEQSGMIWTAKAKRDNADVELRVERLLQPASNLDENRVKQLLETEGFSEVDDVEKNGNIWRAEAKRDDEDVKVHLDAQKQVVVSERGSN